MLVSFNRLPGMEKLVICFSSSIRPKRVYWNIIIKTLMQGLYLVIIPLNYDEETFMVFCFCVLPVEREYCRATLFSSMALLCKQLKGVRGSLWPRHGALLIGPHAVAEQVHVGVVLTFFWC